MSPVYDAGPFEAFTAIHFPAGPEFLAVGVSLARKFSKWIEPFATHSIIYRTADEEITGGEFTEDWAAGICDPPPESHPPLDVDASGKTLFTAKWVMEALLEYATGTSVFRYDVIKAWKTRPAHGSTAASGDWTGYAGLSSDHTGITAALPSNTALRVTLTSDPYVWPMQNFAGEELSFRYPRGHWLDAGGGAGITDSNDVPVFVPTPSGTGRDFGSAMSSTFGMFGNIETGGPSCYYIVTGGGPRADPYWDITFDFNHSLGTVVLAPAATFEFMKKTYDLVGSRREADDPLAPPPGEDPNGYGLGLAAYPNGRMWYLYKRNDDEDSA